MERPLYRSSCLPGSIGYQILTCYQSVIRSNPGYSEWLGICSPVPWLCVVDGSLRRVGVKVNISFFPSIRSLSFFPSRSLPFKMHPLSTLDIYVEDFLFFFSPPPGVFVFWNWSSSKILDTSTAIRPSSTGKKKTKKKLQFHGPNIFRSQVRINPKRRFQRNPKNFHPKNEKSHFAKTSWKASNTQKSSKPIQLKATPEFKDKTPIHFFNFIQEFISQTPTWTHILENPSNGKNSPKKKKDREKWKCKKKEENPTNLQIRWWSAGFWLLVSSSSLFLRFLLQPLLPLLPFFRDWGRREGEDFFKGKLYISP